MFRHEVQSNPTAPAPSSLETHWRQWKVGDMPEERKYQEKLQTDLWLQTWL